MKKNIVSFLILINLLWGGDARCAALVAVAGGEEIRFEDLTDDQIARIPLLYRGDAVAFCREVGPLLRWEEPRNPYELYMEASIFGRCLGLFSWDRISEYGTQAISNLVSASEIEGEKGCLVAGLGLHVGEDLRGHLRPEVDSLADNRREFEGRFFPALHHLREDHNLFAYFTLGFFEFERGLSTASVALKTEGEYLLEQTAYGYCVPAISILRKIYERRGIDTALMEKRKKILEDVFKKPNDGGYLVKLAIEEDIYPWPQKTMSIAPSSSRIEVESLTIHFRNKFLNNVLLTLSEDQIDSYERMNRFLVEHTERFDEENRTIMNDCTRFYTQLVFPLISAIGSGASLAGSLIIYFDPDSNDSDIELGLVGTICSATVLACSCLIIADGFYEHNSRPFFTLLPRMEVTYHCSLSSLYAAISILKPHDCAAGFGSGFYNLWFFDRTGISSWSGCRRTKTLSQFVFETKRH